MVAAALDAAAGWEAPQGRSPYDPMTEILAYEPPAAGSSPLAWLLNGWAAGWRQGGREGGKYAPNLLAAIKGAAPSEQRSKFDPISGGCCLATWLQGLKTTHCVCVCVAVVVGVWPRAARGRPWSVVVQ